MSALTDLGAVIAEVVDLERAAGILYWDQEVNMPPGAVNDKANQLSTLALLAHQRFVSPETKRLLAAAERETAGAEFDSYEKSVARVTRRDFDHQEKVPAVLVEQMARASAITSEIWVRARPADDWAAFKPRLEVTVELSRRLAEALGYEEHPYDALLDLDEPGLTTQRVQSFFAELRTAIVPLVSELQTHQDRVDDSVLDRELDVDRQLQLSREIVAELGYSFEHGRLDISAHPFTIAVGAGDVRITTRVKRQTRDSCLFSSIHEAGHAMYYQGIDPALDRTRLWDASSPGFNESQSRFWENQVGRSLAFWRHYFPRLQQMFPEELGDQDAEAYYRAVNKVRPSYIRVDADEVTYNLHVMLRFELEKALMEGSLKVADVPEAWNAKLKEYLGLEPPPLRNGCLQDVHWCHPQLGGFVGYTLGNAIAAQLMESIRADLPDFDARIEAAEFGPVLRWLNERIHVHGRKFTPEELVERVTGRALSATPLINYLETKFRAIYGLAQPARA